MLFFVIIFGDEQQSKSTLNTAMNSMSQQPHTFIARNPRKNKRMCKSYPGKYDVARIIDRLE